MAVDVTLVADARAVLGEGPLWDAERGCLTWVDIDRGALHRFDGREDRVVRVFEAPLGAACLGAGGSMVVGLGMDVLELREAPDGGGELRHLARATRGERINDGTCDARGRFFFGTKSAEPGGAALYRLDPDGSLATVLEDATISNGIDWSPDGALMYYVDTPVRTIDAFDYDDATGALSGRRRFASFDGVEGSPDGLTVDRDGRVWVAMCHGAAVRCYEPDGALAEVISLPVKKVTSLAFGGPALDQLYITTGSWDFSAREWQEQPQAGGLFRCRPGVTGRPPSLFGAARRPGAPS